MRVVLLHSTPPHPPRPPSPHKPNLLPLLLCTRDAPLHLDIQLAAIVFPLLIPHCSLDQLARLQHCRNGVFPAIDQQHALAPVRIGPRGAGGECHAAVGVGVGGVGGGTTGGGGGFGPLFGSSGSGHDVVARELEEGVEPDDEAV